MPFPLNWYLYCYYKAIVGRMAHILVKIKELTLPCISNHHTIHCCCCLGAAAKLLQAFPTLCDPMDYSLPGSSIHGIFQARVVEWAVIAFSGLGAKSCLTLLRPHGLYSPPGSSVHGISQARILEWVAISFSRGSSQHRDQNHISCFEGGVLSCSVMSDSLQSMNCSLPNSWIKHAFLASLAFPALGGGFFITEPPGKLPYYSLLYT